MGGGPISRKKRYITLEWPLVFDVYLFFYFITIFKMNALNFPLEQPQVDLH